MSIFHLAYHVTDLDEARAFYGGLLGCAEGRSTDTWVDFDFFGHQISLHVGKPFETTNTGKVGDHMVPMPHMGVILPMEDWQMLADRLTEEGLEFELAPSCALPENLASKARCSSATPQATRSRSKVLLRPPEFSHHDQRPIRGPPRALGDL